MDYDIYHTFRWYHTTEAASIQASQINSTPKNIPEYFKRCSIFIHKILFLDENDWLKFQPFYK